MSVPQERFECPRLPARRSFFAQRENEALTTPTTTVPFFLPPHSALSSSPLLSSHKKQTKRSTNAATTRQSNRILHTNTNMSTKGKSKKARTGLAKSSSTSSSSEVGSTLSNPPSPISLITFNTYLFPVAFRHSLTYADKQNRADLILKHMRRNQTTATEDKEERGIVSSQEEEREGRGSRGGMEKQEEEMGRGKRKRKQASGSSSNSSSSSASTFASISPLLSPPLLPSPASASSSSSSSSGLLSADIVCLQEVLSSFWCRKWQKHFASIALSTNGRASIPSFQQGRACSDSATGAAGEYHLVFSPPPRVCSGVLLDGGLLTASRYPILHSSYQSFKQSPLLMRFVDKGFQHCVIDLSERNQSQSSSSASSSSASTPSSTNPPSVLHVINTHLHPYESSWSVEHGRSVRRAQALEIRSYLLSTSHDPDFDPRCQFDPLASALVITGDLNTPQSTEECSRMQEILDCPHVSLIEDTEATMHSHHDFCNHMPEQTICGDFALANKRVRMEKGEIIREAWTMSDHYPVKVNMEIR